MVSSRPSGTSRGWEIAPPGASRVRGPLHSGEGARRVAPAFLKPQGSVSRHKARLSVLPRNTLPWAVASMFSELRFLPDSEQAGHCPGCRGSLGGLGPLCAPPRSPRPAMKRVGIWGWWWAEGGAGEVGGCGVGRKTNFISSFFFLKTNFGIEISPINRLPGLCVFSSLQRK